MSTPHSSWAEVYDIAYEHAYGGLLKLITEATLCCIKDLVHPPARIVDFGAGTGRLSIPLAGMGYQVTAVDPCPEMLAQLKTKDADESVDGVCCRMQDFAEKPFDLALCVFTVLLYLLDEDSLDKSIRAASRCLSPGGRLLIDVPSLGVFNGHTTKEGDFERVVEVEPKTDSTNLYNYQETITVTDQDGEKTSYCDLFTIRYWDLDDVLRVAEAHGLVLEQDLSKSFAAAGSQYFQLRKSK